MSARFDAVKRSVLLATTLFALSAAAAPTVDTGTPDGNVVGALAFDSNDYYAGRVSFEGATSVRSILGHILGGSIGETFTVALHDDAANHAPGLERFVTTAVFGSDGWNGVSGLTGWNVGPGDYWIAFEIGFGDSLGSASDTGALLDVGAPHPLSRTAFNAGSGYQATATPLGFGLRVDAVAAAVHEPSSMALVFAGLAGLVGLVRRRR